MKFTSETAREHGSKGGRTTVERHGREHMSQIGARGFATTVERHWDGDAEAYKSWLQARGWLAQDPDPESAATSVWRQQVERLQQGGARLLRRRAGQEAQR